MAIVINGNGTVTGISVGGLPDDIVDAGTLADNAVGLAQMAGGTDGNIITYDTSGNPAVVATGSSGQVLTSAGADAVPTMATLAANDNTPSFAAKRNSGEQSLPNATWTKIEFPNEYWDTDSAFDTTNDKFVVPAGEGGGYLFIYGGRAEGLDDGEKAAVALYLNGAIVSYSWAQDYSPATNQQLYIHTSCMINLSAADYVEMYAYQNKGSSKNFHNGYMQFTGCKIST